MISRILAIIFIVLGVLMVLYTSINFFTSNKVVDLGDVKIYKEKEHNLHWTPIARCHFGRWGHNSPVDKKIKKIGALYTIVSV